MHLVKEFLEAPVRNQWLFYPDKEIYVRKGLHRHHGLGISIPCFDVASIQVYEKGQGEFTRWFNELQRYLVASRFNAIFIESVLNRRLADHFRKLGLHETPALAPDFFLMLNDAGSCK